MTLGARSPRLRMNGWLSFTGWAVVGGGALLGFFTLFTVGWLLLAVAAALSLALTLWRRPPLAPLGAISGAGIPLLVLYWDNRQGPGTVCQPAGAGTECITTFMSPLPFLLGAVILLVLGCVLYATLHPTTRIVAKAE